MHEASPTNYLPSIQSTGGYYTFFVNQPDGVIVALDISSPRHAVKTHWKSIGGTASPEDLPKLQYASDLMWGKWVENNPDVRNLQYYVVHNILNDETSAIVPRAMRNKLVSKLETWPGTIFEKDSDQVEFQALIGKEKSLLLVFDVLTTSRLTNWRYDCHNACAA